MAQARKRQGKPPIETVPLRDYDFAAARASAVANVDIRRGLVFDEKGIADGSTHALRTLHANDRAGVATALTAVEQDVLFALKYLQPRFGGAPVAEFHADLPLVRVLMMLAAHPSHPGFHARWPNAEAVKTAEVLEALRREATPASWSLGALEATLVAIVHEHWSDVEIPIDRPLDLALFNERPWRVLRILHRVATLDAASAFATTFTRQDALVGEWWLLQPRHLRLGHRDIAHALDLSFLGYMPQTHVDVPGRVLLACFDRSTAPIAERAAQFERTESFAGMQHVTWVKGEGPLADPSFDLAPTLDGLKGSTNGPYVPWSQLPAYP